MKHIKLRYLLLVWLVTSICGAYLNITHTAAAASELLLAITLLAPVLILMKLYLTFTRSQAKP